VADHLLQVALPEGVARVSVFLAPLSQQELEALRLRGADLQAVVTDVMRRKLFRRTRRLKGDLSPADMDKVERRARAAWGEMQMASRFDHVLVNHDGEDSENWTAWPYPVGDAFLTLRAVCQFLQRPKD